MSKAPSMPIYWDAYLADTTHLTTEEHGAYLLLLAAMWRRNGWVPDDDRDNARIVGLTSAKWRRAKERLGEFLVFNNGQISQKNLLKIWENTQEKIEKNRSNGTKGGRPKSNKNNCIAKANGFVSDNPNKSIPEPEPDIKTEPKGSSKKPTPRAELQTILNEETADAVLEHRQRLRKPLTAFAAKQLAGQFAKCADPNAAAAEMIEAGWQGFKPEWLENRRNSGQGPPPKPNIGQQINNRQKRIIAGFMGENIDERDTDNSGFVDLARSDYRFGD